MYLWCDVDAWSCFWIYLTLYIKGCISICYFWILNTTAVDTNVIIFLYCLTIVHLTRLYSKPMYHLHKCLHKKQRKLGNREQCGMETNKNASHFTDLYSSTIFRQPRPTFVYCLCYQRLKVLMHHDIGVFCHFDPHESLTADCGHPRTLAS